MSIKSKSNISSSIDKSVLAGLNFKKSILTLTEHLFSILSKEDIKVLKHYKSDGYTYMNNLCRNSNIDFTNIKLDNYNIEDVIGKESFTYINKVKNPYEKQGTDNINYIIYDIVLFIKSILHSIHIIDTIFTKVKYTFKDLSKAMQINNEYVLYRGTHIPNICNYKLGDTLSFNEYLSCSNTKKVSLGFINIFNPDHVFFIIKNIDKCPFIFIDWKIGEKDSKIKLDIFDEYECLLPRYCEFKITKLYYTSSYYKYYKYSSKQHIINKINNEIDDITNYKIKKEYLLSIMKNIKDQKLRVIELEFVKWNKPQCDISKILKENIKLFSKRVTYLKLGISKYDIMNTINNATSKPTLKKTKNNINNNVISSNKNTKTSKTAKTAKTAKTVKAVKTDKADKAVKIDKTDK